jgi:hypothetical protein
MSICFEPEPLIANPTVTKSAPVPTNDRIERLMIRALPVGGPPTVAGADTVRVAVPLTLEPAEFASCTRNRSPLNETEGSVTDSVAVVAPLKVGLLLTLVHVVPESVDVSH